MPATQQDYEKIQQMQEASRKVMGEKGVLSAGAETFKSRVMDKVRDIRAKEGLTQLSDDVGRAMYTLSTSAPQIRERMGDTVDPLTVDTMTSMARGQNLAQLASVGEAKEALYGTMGDWIEGGTGQLKAAAIAKEAEANRLKQEANDLATRVQLQQQAEKQAFDQYYKQQQLDLERQKLAQTEQRDIEDYLSLATKWKNLQSEEKLDSSVKTKAGEYLSLLNDLNRAKGLIEEGVGKEDIGFGQSVLSNITGPLAPLLGSFAGSENTGYQARTAINNIRAGLQHEKYGSALSKHEKETANTWLPGSKMQETRNIGRLDEKIKQKENELRSLLKSHGLTEEEVQKYISEGTLPQTGASNPFLQQFNLLMQGGQTTTQGGITGDPEGLFNE